MTDETIAQSAKRLLGRDQCFASNARWKAQRRQIQRQDDYGNPLIPDDDFDVTLSPSKMMSICFGPSFQRQ
jgi:hypothetical protein